MYFYLFIFFFIIIFHLKYNKYYTLNKTNDDQIYTGNVRIEWPDPDNENWFVFATSKITMKMENIDFIEYSVERYAAQPESVLIRVWPLNFDEYNNEFY